MNIPEILVANGFGAVMMVFLFLLRVQNSETKQIGAGLYDGMLAVTLLAEITETASFLLDGGRFPGCRFLLYLTNTLCTGSTVLVGFLWCLFVDFRLYRSILRLKKKVRTLGVPLAVILLLLVLNLFGTGLIFRISGRNVYTRGAMNFLLYVLLLFYFCESIWQVYNSKRSGMSVIFFPVYYFVIPCILGTLLQGVFYGIAVGWLAVSVAFVFVHVQLQNFNTYLDELSGLFNRKYLNYYLEKIHKTKEPGVYGLMLDVNDFKKINDKFGHLMGDRAIHEIGQILSASLTEGAIAMRMAGDEFIVILNRGTEEKLAELKQAIDMNLRQFNRTTDAPFQLSFSVGTAGYHGGSTEEFLANLDRRMYEAKQAYHQAKKQ